MKQPLDTDLNIGTQLLQAGLRLDMVRLRNALQWVEATDGDPSDERAICASWLRDLMGDALVAVQDDPTKRLSPSRRCEASTYRSGQASTPPSTSVPMNGITNSPLTCVSCTTSQTTCMRIA